VVTGGTEEMPVDPWNDPDVEIVSPSEVERWKWEQRTRHIRETLAGWAHVAGFLGALASVLLASWELAVFVHATTAYLVGKGVAHVVTDEDRLGRALFFGLPPLAGVIGLVVGRVVLERWWAAVLIGGAAALVGNVLAKRFFRRVAWEERLESLRGS
jgi:hypothetical protein